MVGVGDYSWLLKEVFVESLNVILLLIYNVRIFGEE